MFLPSGKLIAAEHAAERNFRSAAQKFIFAICFSNHGVHLRLGEGFLRRGLRPGGPGLTPRGNQKRTAGFRKSPVAGGSWLSGSWLLNHRSQIVYSAWKNVHFDIVLARLAAVRHVFNPGIIPHGEQFLVAA